MSVTLYEKRPDCADFEMKQSLRQYGSCQTDGHYLCGGCRHIAPFDEMEEGDNAMRYYPQQERERIKREEAEWLEKQKREDDK